VNGTKSWFYFEIFLKKEKEKKLIFFFFFFYNYRITNSPIADVFVVWARTEDKKLRGFLLERVSFLFLFFIFFFFSNSFNNQYLFLKGNERINNSNNPWKIFFKSFYYWSNCNEWCFCSRRKSFTKSWRIWSKI